MSLAFNIYKNKKQTFYSQKETDNMKLWSSLALNCLSLSSEEAEKTASSSHKEASVSLTPGAGTMETQAQHV